MIALSKYLTNYFNFKGLTTRKDYFITALILIIPVFFIFGFFFLPAFVLGASNSADLLLISIVITSVYFTINIIPFIAMTWRRLHDAGYTGVFALNLFVPLGIIVLIGFICLPTQTEANSYRIAWEKQPAGATKTNI